MPRTLVVYMIILIEKKQQFIRKQPIKKATIDVKAAPNLKDRSFR
ncbi:hypothetical protein [Bacillus sp. SM2101]|nr:hypothetical protein [Bacillus sp. SM2101]